MKLICCLLSIVMLLLTQDISAQRTSSPNIVFILADDLGYGDLSCYGQQKFSTPHIDKIASQGMMFTQFYAGASVCAPSRSSLISGQHTGHTYIRGNKEIFPEGQEPIPDSVSTIAEVLQKVGYVTGAFGKWGLGFVGTSGDPLNQGFDQFYGYNCQRESHRYYPGHLWDNNKKIILKGNDGLTNKVTYAPDLIQAKALSFIDQNRSKPFFLYLTYTLPHAELLVPNDALYQKYAGKLPENNTFIGEDYGKGATQIGYASQALPHATFAAMVTRLDEYVGQVMLKLKELNLDKNTLIVFTSDNGTHNEGGADPTFFNSGGGLRGIKRDLYEGGIRVPFIVKLPGRIKAGSKNNFMGAFWDIYPTFSRLTGQKVTNHTDGISMLPTLYGVGTQKQHGYLYWEFHEMGGRQAVRKGKWKGIALNVKKGVETFELYDLETDIAETNDVASKYPDIVSEMKYLMKKSHQENAIFPFLN